MIVLDSRPTFELFVCFVNERKQREQVQGKNIENIHVPKTIKRKL